MAAGIQQGAVTITGQQPGTEGTEPSSLEAANERAARAEARVMELEGELARFKKSWVYRMCPVCFRAPGSSKQGSNN